MHGIITKLIIFNGFYNKITYGIDFVIYFFLLFQYRQRASSGSERHSDVIFLVGEEPDIQRIPAHR